MWINLLDALVAGDRAANAAISHHLRPREDLFLPRQNRESSFLRSYQATAIAVPGSLPQRKSVPSVHMRWRTTARRRATATMARRIPRRGATFIPQALSHDQCRLWVIRICAASYSIVRSMVSPDLEMPPS